MRWDVNVAPVARTAMDRKGARSLDSYAQSLHRFLDKMVPWVGQGKIDHLKKVKERGPDKTSLLESEALAKQLGL